MNREVFSPTALFQSVYAPPLVDVQTFLKETLGGRAYRCAYGRQALAQAFQVLRLQPGEAVLLPGLICRELLSALNLVGAVPRFYPVGPDLRPAISPRQWPAGKAIIAVNYFGFPQDLGPFVEYCRRTGATLIEDNAHGLFGHDKDGAVLGTRGDIGIFSFRKSLPVPDGAAMVVNRPGDWHLRSQLRPSPRGIPLSFRLKQTLRSLVPLVGHRPLYRMVCLVRGARSIWQTMAVGRFADEAHCCVPSGETFCRLIADATGSRDGSTERHRRRALYLLVQDQLEGVPDITPVFKELPEYVVPLAYPFYAGSSGATRVRAVLRKIGLLCAGWPELPQVVLREAPAHYTRIQTVQFLW